MDIPKKRKTDQKIIYGLIFVAIMCGVAATMLNISNDGAQTLRVNTNEPSDYLYCTSRHPNSAFFPSKDSLDEEHTIKILFNNNKLNKISYSLHSNYSSPTVAEQNNANFVASFNIYLGQNHQNPEIYYPTFVALENDVRINIFATKDNFNNIVAKIFLLDTIQADQVLSADKTFFQKFYNQENFTCQDN